MNRQLLFVLSLLLFPTACLAQTTPNDSKTLQSLLLEVRQLRQDLQTTTIAGQRAQILIYRVQGQEAAVARASQRLDEFREKLARIQDERKHVAHIPISHHQRGSKQSHPQGKQQNQAQPHWQQHQARPGCNTIGHHQHYQGRQSHGKIDQRD